MAKLVMWNLMTLDGFVEGPDHDLSWHSDVWGEELERLSVEQLASAGGLIDEFRIAVNPLILGGGTPLFKQGDRIKLKLLDARTQSTGIIVLRYRSAT